MSESAGPRAGRPDLDRLEALARIGATEAASAFARLAERDIRLAGTRVCAGADALPPGDWKSGVFFEFEGYMDALVGILFRAAASEAVVRHVVGEASGPLPEHHVESALMELGNILASHVASAIADREGVRLLPSIPTLGVDAADRLLADLQGQREGAHPVRIECELAQVDGPLSGLLVMIPRRSE